MVMTTIGSFGVDAPTGVTSVRRDAVAAKLAAWAGMAAECRLVHVDHSQRETELQRYALREGDRVADPHQLSQVIASDLENDAATYPSPQRYHVIARAGDGAIVGTMRFVLAGALPLPRQLEAPNGEGLVAQLMRHLEATQAQNQAVFAMMREAFSEILGHQTKMIAALSEREASELRDRIERQRIDREAMLLELRETEEQARKNATHQDIREAAKLFLRQHLAGNDATTTDAVDRLLGSINPDQLAHLQSTFTESQLRELMLLREGMVQRQKDREKEPKT